MNLLTSASVGLSVGIYIGLIATNVILDILEIMRK